MNSILRPNPVISNKRTHPYTHLEHRTVNMKNKKWDLSRFPAPTAWVLGRLLHATANVNWKYPLQVTEVASLALFSALLVSVPIVTAEVSPTSTSKNLIKLDMSSRSRRWFFLLIIILIMAKYKYAD